MKRALQGHSRRVGAESTGAMLLPMVLEEQIRAGGFEYALCYLLERVDLSQFEARYRNEAGGASAYPRGCC